MIGNSNREAEMANELLRLMAALRAHRNALLQAVPESHRDTFEARLDELTAAASERPQDEEETFRQTMALLDENPAAMEALRKADPAALPAPEPPPPVGAGTPPPPAATGAPPPAATGGPPPDNGATGAPPPDNSGAPPVIRRDDSGAGGGGKSAVGLQWLRELTTTVLALMIVGLTLWIALNALGLVGDTTKAPGVKDLLNVLLGPAGVVIGFYFGRVPAEAHAADATQRAEAAATDRDRMRAEAKRIADEMENSERAATTRGDPMPTADLRALRDRLRAL